MHMPVTKPSPNFTKLLTGAARGQVVVPLLRAALCDPKFKPFDITVKASEQRYPDGYFHPSTHPLWPERMLYYYLCADEYAPELLDPNSVMAMAQGNFWHELIGAVGKDAGVFLDLEVFVCDEDTGARGSMDWLLDGEVGEFKTMRPGRFMGLPKNTAPDALELQEAYKKMSMTYYAQAQEYMRLSGLRRHRTVVMSMEYPFDMAEIVLDYDHGFAQEIKDKYRRVRQAVADHIPPDPCCGPRSKESKECPARYACPVAAL